MTENELTLAIHATPEVDVIRAALHSFYSQGEGLVASLFVLEHRVEGTRHDFTEQACLRWLLSPLNETLFEPSVVVDVYRRMAAKALAVGAKELHVALPRAFTEESITSEKVREMLEVEDNITVFVYADNE
ncbi:MAG: hypothetical protein Q7S87_00875 [Agitococcus sp.]|nr:hypothetical protein [Agitococcus sp.]MDO9177154.1 hypothetical protein [Agitococcus sp.]